MSWIDELAGAWYRALPQQVPDLILKRLGVATPRRRTEFYTLSRLLNTAAEVPGPVIECGTYRGGTLLGMAHILRRRAFPATLYGLDSFEGFPEPTQADALESGALHPDVVRGGLGDVSYDDLVARIQRMGFDGRIILVKGYFDDTLPQLSDQRFFLAHLDCDLYESYMSCLRFLYSRMMPGGFIVFDDYGSPVYLGADRAVNEFFVQRPEVLQYFPEAPGRRYFVRIGGGLTPGAVAAR